jgi:hypothetical protein
MEESKMTIESAAIVMAKQVLTDIVLADIKTNTMDCTRVRGRSEREQHATWGQRKMAKKWRLRIRMAMPYRFSAPEAAALTEPFGAALALPVIPIQNLVPSGELRVVGVAEIWIATSATSRAVGPF